MAAASPQEPETASTTSSDRVSVDKWLLAAAALLSAGAAVLTALHQTHVLGEREATAATADASVAEQRTTDDAAAPLPGDASQKQARLVPPPKPATPTNDTLARARAVALRLARRSQELQALPAKLAVELNDSLLPIDRRRGVIWQERTVHAFRSDDIALLHLPVDERAVHCRGEARDATCWFTNGLTLQFTLDANEALRLVSMASSGPH